MGAHILSGAVLDPSGLDRLIPDWKDKGAPLNVPVKEDNFYVLGESGEVRIPNFRDAAADEQPRQLHRLDGQCLPLDGRNRPRRWASRSFPGMACSELVYNDDGSLKGVVAGVFGLEPDGSIGGRHRAWHGTAWQIRIPCPRGVRGSLSKEVIAKYDLARQLRRAEIRSRHEGNLGGGPRETQRRAK